MPCSSCPRGVTAGSFRPTASGDLRRLLKLGHRSVYGTKFDMFRFWPGPLPTLRKFCIMRPPTLIFAKARSPMKRSPHSRIRGLSSGRSHSSASAETDDRSATPTSHSPMPPASSAPQGNELYVPHTRSSRPPGPAGSGPVSGRKLRPGELANFFGRFRRSDWNGTD